MIKGLDNGYLYTKDNERRMFKSAYSQVDSSLANITIDGVDYCVGTGSKTIELDKTDQEINKVCTLYNLKLTGDTEYFLAVGLPIAQFKTQREKFQSMIMSYNDCKVSYKDKDYQFKINDVLVFPQGAAAMLTAGIYNGDYIIFDIGGLTIDIGWVEMNNGNPIMQKYHTWYQGMQKLYPDIINEVNNRYNLTSEPDYAEKIFVNGLTYKGEKQDLIFLEPTLNNFFEPILTTFELNYPAKTTPILLCGGGANVLYHTFKAHGYKQLTLHPDGQFANAIGYYNIGCQKWGRYINQRKGVML